ncbi:MAG: hypothetical protein U1D00_08825 [Mycobacterium sp.]|nr:hypothetical protein [Mycobacterium sp.]
MARIACWRIDLVIGDLGANTARTNRLAIAACDRTGVERGRAFCSQRR